MVKSPSYRVTMSQKNLGPLLFPQHDTAVPKQARYFSFSPPPKTHQIHRLLPNAQGNHLPLIPRSTFIKRLMIESRVSPCLISILVEKWPLDGWGFTMKTDTPGLGKQRENNCYRKTNLNNAEWRGISATFLMPNERQI